MQLIVASDIAFLRRHFQTAGEIVWNIDGKEKEAFPGIFYQGYSTALQVQDDDKRQKMSKPLASFPKLRNIFRKSKKENEFLLRLIAYMEHSKYTERMWDVLKRHKVKE